MRGKTLHARTVLLAASALGASWSAPVWAQSNEASAISGNDIVVTARRVEERLQDVPISITVLNQEALANNNVTSAKDLTTYTPGLVAQGRYGNDNVAFTIRGFSQEQRTTATVGTYFGDVVMPRGSGASQGGDGAGPGQLFDLENVQVLKGPQGTLQGRNSTGGAVLLVPKKPTHEFEGFVEGSIGDYDLRRVQAVVNIPVMESLRIRVGIDRNRRDGYLNNTGNLGTGKYGYGNAMGSTNYWAARFSMVADLSPDVENYTIVSFVDSKSSPSLPKMIKAWADGTTGGGFAPTECSATATSPWCAQFAREADQGKWAVSNSMPDTRSILKSWQVINSTKWQVSDNFEIKNIFSYAELRTSNNMDLYGNYLLMDGVNFGAERPDQVMTFAYTHDEATSGRTNAESSMVEELRFTGNSTDGKFVWQGGLYYEASDPLGFSGVQTAIQTPCLDINTWDCRTGTGRTGRDILGTGSLSVARTKFRSRAIYGQASYDLTDKLTATVGARYTWDKMSSHLINESWIVNPAFEGPRFRCTNPSAPGYAGTTAYPLTYDDRFSSCRQNISSKSSAPTWVLGLDYKPFDDGLFYVKYSRGYRQGGLTIFGADPIQPYDKEIVDSYEGGAKLSWRGSMPGHFNIAGYYNDFKDQQLQAGAQCDASLTATYKGPCTPTTAIINAGKSRLYGFEADVGIRPFAGLSINAAYAYLKTKITEIPTTADILASLPPDTLFNSFTLPRKGDELNFAMPHKVTLSAQYVLPFPESVGKISLGGTWVYQAAYRAVTDNYRTADGAGTGNGIVPSAKFANINVTWEDVMQLPVDAAFFMTNVTNKVVYTHVNDQQSRSNISAMLAEPRMYGFRLRYKFGN